jgi:sterol desaturase/sphingolipid hydroxylase (fatty acid hydroxylase superfamily)
MDICQYILFYDMHFRLLHHRLLYKRLHKVHHEWTAPVAPAALYSHPIEHVFTGEFFLLTLPAALKSTYTSGACLYR